MILSYKNKNADYGMVMKIINTYPAMMQVYEGSVFSFKKWKAYIDSVFSGISSLLISDAKKCLESGDFSWEKDYLPILNAVAQNAELRKKAQDSFSYVIKNLGQTIYDKFGRELDVDIVFYLGLCNGAGWVTEYQGRKVVLLGVEKIMELNWCGIDDMRGLIYHELGHVYQEQYGILKRTFDNKRDHFLWQLFTEGVAMYFEQTLVGDPNYFHQDADGWKKWCDDHLEEIKSDFNRDLETMTLADQRYFGDWVKYNGYGDVGYYLGCRFIWYILSEYEFDEIICFDIDMVTKLFNRFVQ